MPHKCKQTYQQPLDLITLCCFFKFALLLFPDNSEQPSISVLFSIAYKGSTHIIELVQSYAHIGLPNSCCKTARTTTNFFLFTLQESPVWLFPLPCSCCSYLWHWDLGDFHLLSDLGWVLEGSVVLGQRHTLMHINQSDKKSSEVSSEVFPKIPTTLHSSRKHQISYCRSFLQYSFQKCKCRPPNAKCPLQEADHKLFPKLVLTAQPLESQRCKRDISVFSFSHEKLKTESLRIFKRN